MSSVVRLLEMLQWWSASSTLGTPAFWWKTNVPWLSWALSQRQNKHIVGDVASNTPLWHHRILKYSMSCPCYAGEVWKRSFISTVRPTVHTNPSRKRSFIYTVRPTVHTNPSRKRRFISTVGLPCTLIRQENAALFLRIRLPSTLIGHENGALFLRLGLPSTLIGHENADLFLQLAYRAR